MNQFRITVLFIRLGLPNLVIKTHKIEEGHAIKWLKEKRQKGKQRSIVDVGIHPQPENMAAAK